MRSSELARLAGVTVRALRHYHQVGVLAEPSRRANGYRSYDVHDLIRVIRIRRLAGLGISLDRMAGLLDDEVADGGSLLDSLDTELAAQIAQLTEQRAVIARLRAHDAAPDVPPELAPFLAVFAASGMSPDLVRMDRDQSVLLAHLAGESGMPDIARFYERISAGDVAPAIAGIAARFDALGESSSEQEVDELVADFAASIAPLVAGFADVEALTPDSSTALFDEYLGDVLNERQRDALERVIARFGGS